MKNQGESGRVDNLHDTFPLRQALLSEGDANRKDAFFRERSPRSGHKFSRPPEVHGGINQRFTASSNPRLERTGF